MPNHASLYYNTGFDTLLVPANRTATAASASVDLQNADDATLTWSVGAPGDTLSGSVKIEAEVQESDDNSTFTAVADADLTKVVTGATATGTFASVISTGTASQVYMTGYRGTKRYVRVNERRTGTHTTGTPTSALGLRGRNRQKPVNA